MEAGKCAKEQWLPVDASLLFNNIVIKMISVPHKMFDVLPVGGLALPFSPLESILPGNKIETLRLQLYVVEFISLLSKQVKQNYLNIILNFILKTMVS